MTIVFLYVVDCILLACVVILYFIIKDRDKSIERLETLLHEVNESISVNTTMVRNHTDILSKLREDIKILNNEVF